MIQKVEAGRELSHGAIADLGATLPEQVVRGVTRIHLNTSRVVDFDSLAQATTANFFQQRGYDRNPVARRTGVVARLIADMENQMARGAQNPGAKELAAAF